MRLGGLFLAVGLLTACRTPAKGEARPVVAPPGAEVEAQLEALCQSRCERERQMQAMAPEAISAGCSVDCRERSAAPIIVDLSTWSAHAGVEVRAWGRLDRSDSGFVLALADASVPITDASASEDLLPLVGTMVLAHATGERTAPSDAWVVSRMGPAVSTSRRR